MPLRARPDTDQIQCLYITLRVVFALFAFALVIPMIATLARNKAV